MPSTGASHLAYPALRETTRTSVSSCTFQHLQVRGRNGCRFCADVVRGIYELLSGFELDESYVTLYIGENLPLLAVVYANEHDSFIYAEPLSIIELYLEQSDDKNNPANLALLSTRPHSLSKSAPGSMGTLGHALKRAMASNSEGTFTFIKSTVDTCVQKHEKCRQHTQSLPDRVLQIGDHGNEKIFLREPKPGTTGRFIALSYCWGGDQALKLTKQSLASLTNGTEYHALPPLFQDVVSLARMLRIEYVWIDALCTLQDSREDWSVQSAKMGDYYGNAYLVLAAASASWPQDRILQLRPAAADQVLLGTKHLAPTPSLLCARRAGWPFRGQSGDWNGALLSRAWAYQERLLATRIVAFGQIEVKVECRTCSKYESQSAELEGLAQLGFMAEDSAMSAVSLDWRQLTSGYSKLDLSYSTDKLVAFSGIARNFAQQTGWTYRAGLWQENVLQGLMWHRGEGHLPLPYRNYVAPSWSWASCNSAIKHDSMFTAEWTSATIVWDAEVVDIQAKASSSNEFGALDSGSLKLHGWLTPCALVCHDPLHANGHTHRLQSLQGYNWDTYMWPDTVLMVQEAALPGHYLKTTCRAPADVSRAIIKPFIDICYALVLAKTNAANPKGVAMVLGRSPKHDNMFERIGLTADTDMSFFLSSGKRVTVEIV